MKNLEWLKVEIHKELESWYGVEGGIDGDGINEIMLLINQLDESEVLSYKWLSDNAVMGQYPNGIGYVVPANKLYGKTVPKQELPVIPEFVAEWIEEVKPDNSLRVAFEYIAQQKRDNHDDELAFWVEEGNSETFARAWLDGFTVEEEQKYNVKFKVKSSSGTVGIFLYKIGDEVLAGDNFRAYYPKEDKYRLTEQEIRDFQNGDILFEHFAVKVEELEE